ncbi:MAG: hypothetical protein UT09_C0046G0003 [Parcubacteria group bacterium GW2011_GWF2_38_8]|nr:MAG: hypothetical protein UT09_C0046G0003 [Parcubacteria group bacterium GW2011_GWF2_38_8]
MVIGEFNKEGKPNTTGTHEEVGMAKKMEIVEEMSEKIAEAKKELERLEKELEEYIEKNNLA